MDEIKKPLNSGDNHPTCLMDIVDEAYELIDNRVDILRAKLSFLERFWENNDNTSIKNEMEFLKDLRNLLKLSENFRDE